MCFSCSSLLNMCKTKYIFITRDALLSMRNSCMNTFYDVTGLVSKFSLLLHMISKSFMEVWLNGYFCNINKQKNTLLTLSFGTRVKYKKISNITRYNSLLKRMSLPFSIVQVHVQNRVPFKMFDRTFFTTIEKNQSHTVFKTRLF